MNKATFYVTTPPGYPHKRPDIWAIYTVVVADIMARYKRLRGFDVLLLTPEDEPEQGASTWAELGISANVYDSPVSTASSQAMAQLLEQLQQSGDIYELTTDRWYCPRDDVYWTTHDLVSGKCPECFQEVQKSRQSTHYLRLSRYADKLAAYYEQNPDFVQPVRERDDILSKYIQSAKRDIACTLPHPEGSLSDISQAFSDWLKELLQYLNATGYPNYWPANIQFAGKDTLRFHTVYWPILLMALHLPLPEKIYIHNLFHLMDSDSGEHRNDEFDPAQLIRQYGRDAFRYLLVRLISESNTVLSLQQMQLHFERDLVESLENLIQSAIQLTARLEPSAVLMAHDSPELNLDLVVRIQQTVEKVEHSMEEIQIQEALLAVWGLIEFTNDYVRPVLHLDNSDASVLYNLTEVIRIVAILLQPVMADYSSAVFQHFRWSEEERTWASAKNFGMGHPTKTAELSEIGSLESFRIFKTSLAKEPSATALSDVE